MHSFFKSRILSFKFAFSGIAIAIKTQKNLWIHCTIALIVILMAFWLSLSTIDWAILVLTISAVFTAEFFNTSIEATIDLCQPDYHPLAKTAKDVSAAAVLVTAISSIVIGFLILGPPLYRRIVQLITQL